MDGVSLSFDLATITSTNDYLGKGGVLGGGKHSDFVPLSRNHKAGLCLQVEMLLGS